MIKFNIAMKDKLKITLFVFVLIGILIPLNVFAQGQTIKRKNIRKSKVEQKSTYNKSSRNESKKISEAERQLVIDNLINNMVYVHGGSFIMGATPEQESNAEDDEKPAHQVTLSSYSIGRYEVTQSEWKSIMGNNPSDHKGDKFPVENVSWEECQTFIDRLNSITGKHFRLPTESEWEFAARGGTLSKGYRYAGSNNIKSVAWYNPDYSFYTDTKEKTHIVGSKQPNELGLYDMSGNVAEWCEDWYEEKNYQMQTNQKPSYRVVRGGSFFTKADDCRTSNRSYNEPNGTWGHVTSIGFRLAM